MNILFYQHQYPAFGGIETVTTLLARQFVKDCHRVQIVSFRHRDGTGLLEQLPDGASWQELPEEAFDSVVNKTALSAIFDRFGPDVVILQDSYANIHTLLFDVVADYRDRHKVKVFAVEHNEPLGTWKMRRIEPVFKTWIRNVIKFLVWPVYKRRRIKIEAERRRHVAQNVDAYVVLSKFYVRTVQRMLGEKLGEKVCAIPNPMEQDACAQLKKDKIVLFVGNLSITKGVDRMLKIWSCVENKMPDWRFLIVGDGDQRTRLELLARSLGLRRVQFLGAQKRPVDFLMKASIFLSASDYEGWPMTLCEAMSCGCVPLVYKSFGAAKEILDGGQSGFLFRPFKICPVANSLCALMKDEALLKTWSEKALARSCSYTPNKIADMWYQLISEMQGK